MKDDYHYIRLRSQSANAPIFSSISRFSNLDELLNSGKRVASPPPGKEPLAQEEEQEKTENEFETAFKIFWDNISELLRAGESGGKFSEFSLTIIGQNRIESFLQEKGTKIGKERPHYSVFALRGRDLPAYYEAIKYHRDLQRIGRSYPKMLIPTIVSHFDAFIARLLNAIFLSKSDLINKIDKKIDISELLKFSSIDEAKDQFVEKEIDSVCRKSHEQQIKWIADFIGTNLTPDEELRSTFYELTERRNIIVHNDSIVNRKYTENLQSLGITSEIAIGKTAETDWKYFLSATEAVIEMAFKISQVVWRKLDPNNSKADEIANNVTYEMITEKRYQLGKKLFEFCRSPKFKFNSEHKNLVNIINYANLARISDDGQKRDDLIDAIDWSTRSLDFQLCAAAVKMNTKDCCNLMEKNSASIGIDASEYAHWPVFSGVREEYEFKAAFKRIFGFEIYEAPDENNAP